MDNANRKQPTLFIGLGGAGGQIVNRIATILKNRADWNKLERSMQFFALDTDKADLDRCTNISQGHRFVISGFDKALWATEKLGRSGVSKPDADPKVAQWVHDWYNFRSSQGVGAGQIRIESRISLYNCLETTDLISRLERAILDTIDMNNANLAHEVKRFNVFIYYTVAGGTGSGAHLMFAAFLRHLIDSFGWSANIIGVCGLPTFLVPVMRNMRQREDIMANGYAAMKENEHLLRLKVYADRRDPSNRREFVHHPFIASMEVTESPFDFIYVMDTNPEVFIERWRDSVADGIYLQLFSPIFGMRNSDYDNFEKNQKRLSRGLYSTFYGSYGCSVLLLPDRELLEYCTRRKAGDLIGEKLLAKLTLDLPTGEKSYEPTNAELARLDLAERDTLRDKKFFEFMRDRVRIVEKTAIGQETDRDSLGKHGRAMVDAGFMLNPDLDSLEKAVAKASGKSMGKDEEKEISKKLLATENKDAQPDEDAGAGKSLDYRAELLSYLLNFRSLANDVGGTVASEETSGKRQWSNKGLFQGFWEHVDKNCLTKVGRDLAEWRHTPTRVTRSTRDNLSYTEARDSLRAGVTRNLKALNEKRDKVQRNSVEIRNVLDRAFILEFLSKNRQPFEVQRLFVTTQLRLCRAYCATLDNIFRLDSYETAARALAVKDSEISDHKELADAARTSIGERIQELKDNTGADDFHRVVWQLDEGIRCASERYAALLYLKYVRDVYGYLEEVLLDLSEAFRRFSQQAKQEIHKIELEAEAIRRNPGGQSAEYQNDIEALQDFTGERMWREYYDEFVRNTVEIPEDRLHEIIASAFSDARLAAAQDVLDEIGKQMVVHIGSELTPAIVGKYKDGKEGRGLTLQAALECEAKLKYRSRLDAAGRLDEEHRKLWEKVAKSVDGKLHSRSERDMQQDMVEFARNYLQSKIAVGIRRSAIMANIALQDSEVSEFACKQSILCYDVDLYGQAEEDAPGLGFPALVKRLAPEFAASHHVEYGKMAIFYQAILGVPPFVFRNVVSGMKEAYNKRVLERDWTQPLKGRQYPLHIDRNWELGDPGTDETRLPMSLDPEEAVRAYRRTNEGRSRFFSYWYALFRTGHIVRIEGRGFVVPSGKLRNTGADIHLGATAREAILAMMKSQTAHQTIEDAFADAGPLERAEMEKQRDRCLEMMGGDAWGRDNPDPEIRELADLLDEYLKFQAEQDEAAERRRLHTATYNSCIGKSN